MIPAITHPAGELVIRKLNEAAANLGSFAAQLDGHARTLLTERDSLTGLDGFRTAFGEQAEEVLDAIRGFRRLYGFLAGHDVPPLQGMPELALPELETTIPPTDKPPVVDGAAPEAPSAPVVEETPAPPVPSDPPSEAATASSRGVARTNHHPSWL
jgi:hypothetical protein